MPSQPRIIPVEVNLTKITVKFETSANKKGGVPENYTIFYGILMPGYGTLYHTIAMTVEAVGQIQTLSKLKPYTTYAIFVKARNIAGEKDSAPIQIATNASEFLISTVNVEKCLNLSVGVTLDKSLQKIHRICFSFRLERIQEVTGNISQRKI